MIIFLAGASTAPIEDWLPRNYPARLRTYIEVRNKLPTALCPIEFLDSGAFTFQTTKEVMSLEKYADFVQSYGARISASMDVIGDPVQSDKNFRELIKLGAKVSPVMHSDWPTKMIQAYVEEFDFILLGGMVRYAKQIHALKPFLDTVFRCAEPFWPRKFHSFGITGSKLLTKYPFYSADSTRWLTFAKFGRSIIKHDRMAQFRAKTEPGHDKLKGEVQGIFKQMKFYTDLWHRRGITWQDDLTIRANQFEAL